MRTNKGMKTLLVCPACNRYYHVEVKNLGGRVKEIYVDQPGLVAYRLTGQPFYSTRCYECCGDPEDENQRQ